MIKSQPLKVDRGTEQRQETRSPHNRKNGDRTRTIRPRRPPLRTADIMPYSRSLYRRGVIAQSRRGDERSARRAGVRLGDFVHLPHV